MKRTYYFITLFMLILSAKASVISSSEISWFVFELILLSIALKKKLFTYKTIRALFVFAVLFIVFIIFRNLFNKLTSTYLVSDLFFLAKFIFSVFLYGTVMREKAIPYIVKVVSHLAIISLIFYPIQLADSKLVNDIGKIFDLVGLGTHNVSGGYNNYLFFTVYDNHITRNCGFSWEPGAFACILSLTLIFALLRDNFKFNKQTYIISAALITTISTTGYIMLLIIVVLKVLNSSKNKARFVYIIPVVLVMLVIFLNSPVLYTKIVSAYNTDINNSSNYDDLQNYYSQDNKTIPLNRFASVIQIVLAFKYKLVLGVSNKYDEILAKQYNFNISNGIADFFAKFGLIGFIFYLRNYMRFVKAYTTSRFNLFVISVLFVVIYFGEPMLSMPLFLFFAVYPFFWTPVANLKKQIAAPVHYPDVVNN